MSGVIEPGPGVIPNTLKVSAYAECIYHAHTEEELLEVLRRRDGLLLLGGASNVVLGTNIHRAVCLVKTRGISVIRHGQDVEVTAAAGESWHGLVRYCLANGYFGLENLSLIPGTVGAAPLQNIGAYGVELSQRLTRMRAVRLRDGVVRTFTVEECEFGYRDSRFKSRGAGDYAVLDVTLGLSTAPNMVLDYPDLRAELQRFGVSRPTPVSVAEAVIRVRRRKLPDPRHIGNAGSFFKNPLVSGTQLAAARAEFGGLIAYPVEASNLFKLSAAQLIDEAQCKTERHGDAEVWFRQPLVLVNGGSATGADFVALANQICSKVSARFGVRLETEPRIFQS